MGPGNSSAPSGLDRIMKDAGNRFGVDIFPIVWWRNERSGSEINYIGEHVDNADLESF